MAAPGDTKRHLGAGLLASFGSTVALQPLELLKTRMQQEGHGVEAAGTAVADTRRHGSALRQSAGGAHNRPRLFAVLQAVLRNEGFRTLWRGTLPSLARCAVLAATMCLPGPLNIMHSLDLLAPCPARPFTLHR